MTDTTAIPIKASTQEHLSIEDIIDDIVILKDGSCSLTAQVTAINFGLLSETEQDAIIFAYAGLLNSLTFPMQIIVRSTAKDISEYLRLVRQQELKQKKPLLLRQLQKYRQFIESTVKENQVLDKKFYVSIPFTTLELGIGNTIASSFQKKKKLPYPKTYILEKAKMNLYPKRDHLIRQFARLGLQFRQLETKELMELFYSLYNQEAVGQKFVTSKDYNNPIVQPSILDTKPPAPTAPAKNHTNVPHLNPILTPQALAQAASSQLKQPAITLPHTGAPATQPAQTIFTQPQPPKQAPGQPNPALAGRPNPAPNFAYDQAGRS